MAMAKGQKRGNRGVIAAAPQGSGFQPKAGART